MEKTLLKMLLEIKALEFRLDPFFTLASGLKSPVYFDNRKTLSFPYLRTEISRRLFNLINDHFYDKNIGAIVGVATAGIPYGMLAADELSLPFAYVRSSPKEHGHKNLVEGVLEKGQKVVVVEDVVSTGGSSINAIMALKNVGVEILGLVSVFSHEFNHAHEKFKKLDVPFYTLLTITDLINEGEKIGALSEKELGILREWKSEH